MTEVAIGRDGAVTILTLDAPQRRNALSRSMLDALQTALTSISNDVAGIVIAGRDGSFSAGADFAELTGTSADTAFDDAVAGVADAIIAAPVPVVAALEGPCVGAAAHLALACDIRVAGEDSWIQVPAVRLGLLYSPVAVDWLSRRYPRDTIRRLLLVAERFDAVEAQRAGLVSTVAPAGEPGKRAIALLAEMTPAQRPAVALTKALLNASADGVYDDRSWQDRRRELLDSPERRRAVDDAKRRHLAHRNTSGEAHRP